MAGCHRILVTIPDRLGKSNEALSGIGSVVASAVREKGAALSDLAHAEYTFDDIAVWPQPKRDPDAISFFEQRFKFESKIRAIELLLKTVPGALTPTEVDIGFSRLGEQLDSAMKRVRTIDAHPSPPALPAQRQPALLPIDKSRPTRI
jgi:hypothetical protein